MVSLSSARDASAALRMTSSTGTRSTAKGSPRVSLFSVRVPVLSEHSTSTPASSSMATSRLTMAFLLANRRAPTAMVTDRTVGIATGMAATVSTSTNCKVVRNGSPRIIYTTTITATMTNASKIRILPIFNTARWMWLAVLASCTSSAVWPK